MEIVAHPRIGLGCLYALAPGTVAHAQAAAEYAAKSATSALPGGSSAHLGACRIDSTLLPCIRQFYPTTFYVVVAAFCIFLFVLMYPKRRF
ncbi:MAG: hypothetical protein ACJ74Z_11940 [Bryobacteraceae bacterium]